MDNTGNVNITEVYGHFSVAAPPVTTGTNSQQDRVEGGRPFPLGTGGHAPLIFGNPTPAPSFFIVSGRFAH